MLGFQALGRRALGQITADVAVDAEVGAFALTGQAATFAINMPADAGLFTLTGEDAGFVRVRQVSAEVGAFALAGQTATFAINMPAEAGAFALGGQDVTFGYVSLRVFADPGSFTLNGQDSRRLLSLQTAAASFTLTGQTVGLSLGLTAGRGTFALAGQSSRRVLSLAASAGTLTLSGQPSRRVLSLAASKGTFALTGQATFRQRILILYAESTRPARVEHVLSAPLGAVAIGQGSTFDATATTFSFHGQDVRFEKAVTLTAEAGTFVLAGQDAVLELDDYPSNIRIFPRVGRGPRGFSLGGGAAARVSVGSGPRIRIAGG